ncbi:MAG: 5'/3'-nucleotidase SurE [Chloroflexota bacterium]|nr:5'/3'-nucleotidase SurE [Chloroflexota bacterium]
MTYIVVTNDDGYNAPGIMALAQAMREIGTVQVIAPATNQSAVGHKKTLYQDIKVQHVTLVDGTPAVTVAGSPADCIAMAALGLIQWPPRIVVSGINRGPNTGQDVTYSGTVTAALEATIQSIPAVAISFENRMANDVEQYREAARVAAVVVKQVLQRGLPPFTILSVNVPDRPAVKGLRVTRQGISIYRDALIQNNDHYQIAGEAPTGVLDELGTDIWAVNEGYASVTPIHLDLTAHHLMADIINWDMTV